MVNKYMQVWGNELMVYPIARAGRPLDIVEALQMQNQHTRHAPQVKLLLSLNVLSAGSAVPEGPIIQRYNASFKWASPLLKGFSSWELGASRLFGNAYHMLS